ncbi:anti-phage Hailong system effector protein HalA [Asaia bogorensis]|uniref:anti-phage Hailong system effector protein HalA n=1 Tax=Asaia bogorensis TaxID=91915 RepID=UPI002858592A|nr:pentapeptide repeat-containing protein [Asaia bogorensis]MDR6182768.1 hypothetical protein [Asaia bogorensis NBRC 16594]
MSDNFDSLDDTGVARVEVRKRRTQNWWEPIFTETPPESFSRSNWNFKNNRGPIHTLFDADDLKTQSTLVLQGITFEECDFQGVFKVQIVFKDCRFVRCDFGLSTFYKTKFTRCSFSFSTFTQCTLQNCELRNCNYDHIFFSGNETELPSTLIAEPQKFISGSCAPTENLPAGKSRYDQKLRFLETRATLARALLINLTSEGSEESFYEAVKLATVAEGSAKIARATRRLQSTLKLDPLFPSVFQVIFSLLSIISAILGLIILLVMGSLNAWGSSVSRAASVGLISILSIACIYKYYFGMIYTYAIMKTIEIFFLFGYTNYANTRNPDYQFVFANALLGLFWYAVAIPTITNKLTRARG